MRIERRTGEGLERLAKATARSRSYLAAEALRKFVEQNEWQVRAIRKGAQAADEGRVVPGDEVDAWLSSWGRDDERKPPE